MNSLLLGAAAVLFLNVYAAALVVLRARTWRQPLYRPMLLNIGLSLAPLAVAAGLLSGFLLLGWVAADEGQELPSGVLQAALWAFLAVTTGVWLLAFPNSAYLVTELNMSHRRPEDLVPLWFDIVGTLTLTVSGLANAVLSLGLIHFTALLLVDADTVPAWTWFGVAVALLLGALGTYLGRYLRVNSWDIRNPAAFLRRLVTHFRARGALAGAAGFVVTHSLLLACIYVPIFALAHAALVGN